MTRAAIYTRISEDRSGDASGVRRQREDCEMLAAERGLDIVAVFEDNSRSAMKGRRPQYQEMLGAVRAGEIDAVLVWAVDRLYRRLSDLQDLTRALKVHEVPVFACKSGDFDLATADGRLTANIHGSVAQHSSEKKGERVSRQLEQRVRAGKYPGGVRRFGFTDRAPLALVPAEADAIAWGYRHILETANVKAVMREWNRRGLTGVHGHAFSVVTVRDILIRPMNAGLASLKGEILGRSDDIPAIVDEDLYYAVHAILTDPSRGTGRGAPATSLLSGLLWCSMCGGRCNAAQRYYRKTTVESYKCKPGHCVSRSRVKLDDWVTELVLRRIDRQRDGLSPCTSSTVDPALREAEDLRIKLDELEALLVSGDLDAADYARGTRGVRVRLADAERRIAVTAGRRATAALVGAGSDVFATWAGLTVDERRVLLVEHVERITLDRGTPGYFETVGIKIDWIEQ